MPSRAQKSWKSLADEASELLGGSAEGGRRPKLVASVDGFSIEVKLIGSDDGHQIGERFQVSLPGWPTTSGLKLRSGSGRLFRSRYIRFDDPDWDDRFKVKAKDSETVRLHLTRERRAAIAKWFDSYIHDTGLRGPVIEDGQFRAQTQLRSVKDVTVSGPGQWVDHVGSLVGLAKIITQ
jgi:hypothetical protein